MYYVIHSDELFKTSLPPVPVGIYTGWWATNEDGEPSIGPFNTKKEAEEFVEENNAGE